MNDERVCESEGVSAFLMHFAVEYVFYESNLGRPPTTCLISKTSG